MTSNFIDISAEGFEQAAKDLNATEKQVEKALRTTLGKMSAWLRVRGVRGLSAHLQVGQKILRRRLKTFRIRKTADGQAVTVWFGLDNIGLIYLGARETSDGVTAGKHKRKSAFIADGKNGNKQVFKRRGDKRLPLDKQVLEVQDKAQTYIEDKLLSGAEFDAQFFKTFEHELQWQTRTRK